MPEITVGRYRGGYCVVWRENGKRRRYQLTARTAQAAEVEARAKYRRETYAGDGLTVADLWGSYRNEKDDRPTSKTMGYTGKAILPHFGDLVPDDISIEHSRAYVRDRVKAGRKIGAIWTELGHLRTVLNWAQKTRLIDFAPHIELPQKPAPKNRHLTRSEIATLLDAPAEPHIRLAILLMLGTAGRVKAILELTWDRVDFDADQIDLRTDATGPRKGRAVVPMNAGLRDEMLFARQAALSDYVVEYAGKPIASIRRGFSRTVERAGLKDVTPHVLRHTAAVHMAAGGVPMSKISQFLGHSNTAMTERVYARFAPDHLRDAAAVLDFTAPPESTVRNFRAQG